MVLMHRFLTYRNVSVHDKFVSADSRRTVQEGWIEPVGVVVCLFVQIVTTTCVHVAGKVEETPKRITGAPHVPLWRVCD